MGLKKLLKKARKAIGLPALTLGNVAKLGAATAIGGPAGLGAAVLKSKLKSAAIGGIKQLARSKADKAALQRAAKLRPPSVVGIARAQTMPGGAPLRGVRVAAALPARTKTRTTTTRPARKSKRKAGSAPRKPPAGGKDFKALSASWKAAGKPGTWLQWVKSH